MPITQLVECTSDTRNVASSNLARHTIIYPCDGMADMVVLETIAKACEFDSRQGYQYKCDCGEIGRRTGLKIQRIEIFMGVQISPVVPRFFSSIGRAIAL